MDLNALKPTKGDKSVFVVTKGNTAPKPENVFLTKGWLAESYNESEPKMVQGIAGEMTDTVTIVKGPNKGKTVKREDYKGDLKIVVTLIRDAAKELEIGVAIRVIPEVYNSGQRKGEPNGKFTVHYLGKEQKKKREKPVAGVPTAEEIEKAIPLNDGTAPAE